MSFPSPVVIEVGFDAPARAAMPPLSPSRTSLYTDSDERVARRELVNAARAASAFAKMTRHHLRLESAKSYTENRAAYKAARLEKKLQLAAARHAASVGDIRLKAELANETVANAAARRELRKQAVAGMVARAAEVAAERRRRFIDARRVSAALGRFKYFNPPLTKKRSSPKSSPTKNAAAASPASSPTVASPVSPGSAAVARAKAAAANRRHEQVVALARARGAARREILTAKIAADQDMASANRGMARAAELLDLHVRNSDKLAEAKARQLNAETTRAIQGERLLAKLAAAQHRRFRKPARRLAMSAPTLQLPNAISSC